MTSSLKINQFALAVFLGWSAEERAATQKVALDIYLIFAKAPTACLTDDLKDTICYFELTEKLRNSFANRTFKLIEHLAHEVYQLIKTNTPTDTLVTVKLTKHPDIKDLQGGVCFSYGD
ncbi:MAG: dihydroneopterin aldolase [Gammaproteobacteria bacterium]